MLDFKFFENWQWLQVCLGKIKAGAVDLASQRQSRVGHAGQGPVDQIRCENVCQISK